MAGDLSDVPGVLVGQWTHETRTTGVTAVLFPQEAVGGVCVPGSAAGSRELGALSPGHIAGKVHGICLAGGSAFGLAAADGVMDVLLERNVGFETGHGKVPIVPAAILFDLHSAAMRPGREQGRLAAEAAGGPVVQGRVGAAAGALVAKASGAPVPGGVGSAAERVDSFTVGALAAVNAIGSIFDPDSGQWVAGGPPVHPPVVGDWRGQTTLVIVATDAPLDRALAGVMAKMATAGLARTLYPAFTPFDGDTVFAVSTGSGPVVDTVLLSQLGDSAARVVARSIVRAVS